MSVCCCFFFLGVQIIMDSEVNALINKEKAEKMNFEHLSQHKLCSLPQSQSVRDLPLCFDLQLERPHLVFSINYENAGSCIILLN